MKKLVITRFLCTLFYTVVESNSLCTLSIQWLSPIVKKKRLTALCCSNLLGKAIRTKHVAAVSSSVVRNGSKGTSNAFAVPFYRRIM